MYGCVRCTCLSSLPRHLWFDHFGYTSSHESSMLTWLLSRQIAHRGPFVGDSWTTATAKAKSKTTLKCKRLFAILPQPQTQVKTRTKTRTRTTTPPPPPPTTTTTTTKTTTTNDNNCRHASCVSILLNPRSTLLPAHATPVMAWWAPSCWGQIGCTKFAGQRTGGEKWFRYRNTTCNVNQCIFDELYP